MDDLESLSAKVEQLEASVKAQEDDKKEDAKRAIRKASIKKALEDMDDEHKAKFIAALKSSEDKDEQKVGQELEDEHKKDSRTKKGQEDDKKEDAKSHKSSEEEKKELESKIAKLSATVANYETEKSSSIINNLVALKASHVPNFDEQSYRTSLKAKSFAELSALHQDRADEIATLQASTPDKPNLPHFPFTASTQAGDSLENILGESN